MSINAHRPALGFIHVPDVSKPSWTGVRRALLICGALSVVLYFAMDVSSALRLEGYSYKDQTISELSAVGTPTRSLWLVLGIVYSLLVIAGGLGVLASAGDRRSLRVVGAAFVVFGLVGFVWPFAPMHQREVLAAGEDTFQDTMHLVLGGVDTMLSFIMLGFGAAAFGKRFRVYTFATIVALLAFGALTGMAAGKVQDNDPTPWLGIEERISVFGAMVWMAVLAICLWREKLPFEQKESRP